MGRSKHTNTMKAPSKFRPQVKVAVAGTDGGEGLQIVVAPDWNSKEVLVF
jgi:hypothetical protein